MRTYLNKHSQAVKWHYSDTDVQKLKYAYFDYIRLGIPVQRTRIIAKSSSSNSFFCQNNIWIEFIGEHENILKSYVNPDFISIKKSEPNKSNEDIIRDIEKIWKEKFEDKLYDNLSYSEGLLRDFFELHAPIRILKRILNNLGQIHDEMIDDLNKDEIAKLLSTINSRVQALIGSISK